MQTNLYFVRHAHSTYTPDEWGRPLSERGFEDATLVTELLKDEKIDIVISSPYKRAIQTVEGIAQRFNQEIMIIDDLRERKLAEEPVENFTQAIKTVWDNPSFALEGGESNLMAQKRGVLATLTLLETYRGKNIAIGTHGNIMVLIMNYFDPIFDFTFWKNLEMPDIYKLTFEEQKFISANRIWKR